MDTFEDYTKTRPLHANQEHNYIDDENRPLPGFRFHPTDEELVGFYLQAKVDEKPLKIDHLIQDTDIYKHNPWDLPKTRDGGDNHNSEELYFFCKRGRKYRNSERPNRVITGSGFWKATGIDKPIYSTSHASVSGHHHHIIGLKKTLVYYRGSAGKGTKTEWMMHELRLPNSDSDKPAQEAEVWTVCRIFKRINISNKAYTVDRSELQSNQLVAQKNKSCTTMVDIDQLDDSITRESYISFATDQTMHHHYNDDEKRPILLLDHHASPNLQNEVNLNERSGLVLNDSSSILPHHHQPSSASASSSSNFNTMADLQMDQQFVGNYETWDELRYVVHQFDFDSSQL